MRTHLRRARQSLAYAARLRRRGRIMTNLDDRLRAAAASLEPSGAPIPPFKGVRQRARRRRMMGAAGAVVVAVAATFAIASTTRGRDRVLVQNPGPTSTTLAPTTTTTTTRGSGRVQRRDHLPRRERTRGGRRPPDDGWRHARDAVRSAAHRARRFDRTAISDSRARSRPDGAAFRDGGRVDRHGRPVTRVHVRRRLAVDGSTRRADRVHGDAIRGHRPCSVPYRRHPGDDDRRRGVDGRQRRPRRLRRTSRR